MFPAGAGMNRVANWLLLDRLDVPRRRGDEPLMELGFLATTKCSPQARG